MKAPSANTPTCFCELVIKEAAQRWHTVVQTTKGLKIAGKTWKTIQRKELVNLSDCTDGRKTSAAVETISQICAVLDLDLASCLEAVGLSQFKSAVQRGLANVDSGITELTTEDIEALLRLSKELNQPISLPFALEYVRLQRNKPSTQK